jgi:hypothetical protein
MRVRRPAKWKGHITGRLRRAVALESGEGVFVDMDTSADPTSGRPHQRLLIRNASIAASFIAALSMMACDSPSTNASQPAGAPRWSTLVVQKVSRLSGKHLYERSLEGLQSSGMVQLQHDIEQMGSLGFNILECHYDADPTDEYYEVQYYWTYWSVGVMGAELTGQLPTVIKYQEDNLRRANGAAPVRHPFRDYGPPRVACPPVADPQQLTKRIFAPRKPGVSAGKVSAPTITMDGVTTIYSYGPAPEEFVPPIPKDLNPDFHLHPVEFEMKKQQIGSLVRVQLQRFSWQTLTVGESEFLTRPRELELFREDVLAAFNVGGNVIECRYVAKERGFIDHYRYWYKARPAVAETSRLKSRIPDHPILEIRSPLDACPASAKLAESVG